MESSMLQYYKSKLQTLGSEYNFQYDLSSTGDGIGFSETKGDNLTTMVRNFYDANKDNVHTFWHQAHQTYYVS